MRPWWGRRFRLGAMIAESGPSLSGGHRDAANIAPNDKLQGVAAQIRDLMANEGFTELTFKKVIKVSLESAPIVDVLTRAIEVFGTREKALRWLGTPVRSLGDKAPISLLNSPEGLARVRDTLGLDEHSVW
jgi:hypothetical protein